MAFWEYSQSSGDLKFLEKKMSFALVKTFLKLYIKHQLPLMITQKTVQDGRGPETKAGDKSWK